MANSVLNIIKIGGNIIDDERQLDSFWKSSLHCQGKRFLYMAVVK
jgi:acetylglutamate kinase